MANTWTPTTPREKWFRAMSRVQRMLGHNKPAMYRVQIAYCRKYGEDSGVIEGALARELATTPQARALAEAAIMSALMFSRDPGKRREAEQKLSGFVGCGAMRGAA